MKETSLSSPENFFGEGIAERYDESHSEMFASSIVGPAVDFLAGVAGNGAALELGIGTGRIALPLARRGVRVHGIELSEAMVQQLRAKPGGDDVEVTIGDFATTTVEGAFSVAYLVFNTINNLTSQDAQVACFQNVATHLEPGGCFVIEVGVPSLRRLPYGETYNTFHLSESLRWDQRIRRREPGARLPPLHGHRRQVRAAIDSIPLRVAVGAGPHGAARGNDPPRALVKLEARALHEREHQARLGLGKILLTLVGRGELRRPSSRATRGAGS